MTAAATPRVALEAAIDWARGMAEDARLTVKRGPPQFDSHNRVLYLPEPGSCEGIAVDTAEHASAMYRLFVLHEVAGHAKHSAREGIATDSRVVNTLHQALEDGFVERKACEAYRGARSMMAAGCDVLRALPRPMPPFTDPAGQESLMECLDHYVWLEARCQGPGYDLTAHRDAWYAALAGHLPGDLLAYVADEVGWSARNASSTRSTATTSRLIARAVRDVLVDGQKPPASSRHPDNQDEGGDPTGDDTTDADAQAHDSGGDSSTPDGQGDPGSGATEPDDALGADEAQAIDDALDPGGSGSPDADPGSDELSQALGSALQQAVDDVDDESRRSCRAGGGEGNDAGDGSGSGAGGPGSESGRSFPRPRLNEARSRELREQLDPELDRYRRVLLEALKTEGRRRTRATAGSRLDSRRLPNIRMGEQRVWRATRVVAHQPPALTLLLDVSGSVKGPLLDRLLGITYATCEVIGRAGIDAEVALFGGTAPNRAGLAFIKYAHEPIRAGLARLPGVYEYAGGTTPLAEALETVGPRLLQRRAVHRAVFVFTDGQPNDPNRAHDVVRRYRRAGVAMVGFGYGIDVDGLGLDPVRCDDAETFGREMLTAVNNLR